MLGMYSGLAGPFVLGFGAISTLIFALPFIFAPAGWGRAMQWPVPAEQSLMAYYARCLGCLALAFNVMGAYAALHRPALLVAYVAPVAGFCAAMVVLHIYGWARGQQPWTETAEIPMWAALTLISLTVMPA